MIKAVIFDMDGLMFDTEKLAKDGYEYAGKIMGFKVPEEVYYKVIGLNVENTKRVFKEYLGEDFDYDKSREIRIAYADDYFKKNGVPVKEGLYDLLSFLKSNGIKTAVATSTVEQRAKARLIEANVYDDFEAAVYGDMVKRGKPEPDIFLKAAELIEVDVKDCIVLEDSKNGIIAAYRGGFKAVMIPDLIMPDSEIEKMLYAKLESLKDVIDLVKNENSL